MCTLGLSDTHCLPLSLCLSAAGIVVNPMSTSLSSMSWLSKRDSARHAQKLNKNILMNICLSMYNEC